MSQPTVWIIGDWRHADFSAPLVWLKDRARCASYDDAAAALTSRNFGTADNEPAAILLIQSRPGRIAQRDLERLHAAAPLARLVALVGPWCEGEMRSGRPWPGVVRIPWGTWQLRLMHELGLSEQDGSPAAALPRTVTAAERIEITLAALGARECSFRTAAISTSSRASYEAIADVLDQLKIRSVWHSSESGELLPQADLVIFDGWDQVPMEVDLLSGANHNSSSPRLLLLHFPRPDDHARAASLGIATVLAQPLLVTDVWSALEGVFRTKTECQQSLR
ncbi:MAG TPA: hypothetical protein VKH44_10895 [Pirellulaceae bacterium]|nr:hypothetical protein [Pirellulaceae bacterium]